MSYKMTSEYDSNLPKFSNSINHQKSVEVISTFVGLEFEKLISDISTNIVVSNCDELDSIIEKSLQSILDFLELDVAALFYQGKRNAEALALTYLRVRSECNLKVKPFVTLDSFPWILQQFLAGRDVFYSRIDDLPQQASIDKENLHQFGLDHSAVAVPLLEGQRVTGILIVASAKRINWLKEFVSRLRVISTLISGGMIRKKAEGELQQTLEQLKLAKAMLEKENVSLRHEMNFSSSDVDFVYHDEAMNEVLTKVRQVAATNSTVLLLGETGTGKELIASEIHKLSSRSNRTMVKVNCGAIPVALVESEMFGREKGAYTGALTRQIGRFELADKSTIFLDEITELPMEVQVKLLRVIQEKQIERLGSPKPIYVDVRIIAATNQNIEKAVRDGKLREDLYYRLNVFPIQVPPLRERREDIPMLIWHFVDKLSLEFGKRVEGISAKSIAAMMEYSWPGNVRELRNAIERAMIVSNSPTLHIELPKLMHSMERCTTWLSLKELEIQHIRRVLDNASWKIRGKKGAAEILGMKPTTLETRMAKLGIRRPDVNNNSATEILS